MKARDESFPFIPEIHLFHDRDKADKFIRRHFDKVPRFFDTSAQMWHNGGIAAVLMEYEGDRRTEDALLVHEAYHVVAAHYSYLGEESPSEEFVAYGVQVVSKALLKAHDRWRRKKTSEVDG